MGQSVRCLGIKMVFMKYRDEILQLALHLLSHIMKATLSKLLITPNDCLYSILLRYVVEVLSLYQQDGSRFYDI